MVLLAMLQISEIVKKNEEMFDLFNEHFYNKELTRPAITVSPDGGRGAYGWCSIQEIWNAGDEKYRAINNCFSSTQLYQTRWFHVILLPDIIAFSRRIGIYSSAKFE